MKVCLWKLPDLNILFANDIEELPKGGSFCLTIPPTIHPIRHHVHQKPDGGKACFRVKKQKDVNPDGPIGMQRMKIDAAAIRIKNRRCQKMIEIHQHGQEKDQICFFPTIPEK